MMRRITCAVLSLLILALPVLGLSEEPLNERQSKIVFPETTPSPETDGADAFGEMDDFVENPYEEYLYDDQLITDALNMLNGMRNILLLGIDARGDGTGRSDTMVLLTVDIEKQTIKLTSFMRDLYVEIPGRSNNRLNAAYVYGGFELLQKTFEKNFGIHVDAYLAVNLKSLSALIDALGGVYVDVNAKKIDRINAVIYWYNKEVLGLKNPKDGYLTKGGYQLLNGKQAESWARYRYSESDFQRTQRQRELLRILYGKITEMSYMQLIAFATENMQYVKTNMTLSEIMTLAPALLALKDSEISEMRVPIDGAFENKTVSGMAVLVMNRQKTVNALADFIGK